MNTLKLIFISIGLLLLAGCGSNPPPEVRTVTKTEIIALAPPKELTKDCEIVPLFDKEQYMSLKTPAEREEILSNLIVELYSSSAKCNIQMESLREWIYEQVNIYNDNE